MSLACLDSPAPGSLKRQIIEKEELSLTGTACYSLSQLKLLTKALELAHSVVSLANILPTDYFQIYAYVHDKGLH